MKNSTRGFTLIEVLVALIIVAAAIMASASLWSGNFTTMRKSALNYDVATILERKMVEIEAKYSTKQLSEIPEEEDGDFGTEFPQFRWSMKSRDMEFPDLSAMIIGRDEGADETLVGMIKQMTEYLSKAIKEVKVSVFVKRGKKESEFFATQYFVDYSKEFAAAAGGSTPTPTPSGGSKPQ